MKPSTRLFGTVVALASAWSLQAVDDIKPSSSDTRELQKAVRQAEPEIAPASNDAELGLKRIKVPNGFKVDLWAAEPMLANPVSMTIDEHGRVFVAETYRFATSILDIRNYMFMLEDDMAVRTVEDRLKAAYKNFGTNAPMLGIETDQIRLLEDSNGDGKADFSSVYAGGFTNIVDGTASGVLARKGKLWATVIPNLYEFEGTTEKGEAKKREILLHGFGVRFGYTGHDLHGLIMGPDGKLYFSIGDRASNVLSKEGKRWNYADTGAVFRCNPDGTDYEVVHYGLRNPEELAFDEHGNLFTGDNDFDYGDEERLVSIVEGGDSGWRVGYQHPPLGRDRVPWKAEQIWVAYGFSQGHYDGEPNPREFKDTGIRPAAYLPPVSNIGNGPCGFAYYPGTGLPEKYQHHFFLCHSKGSYSRSKVQTFTVKEKGATFELATSEPFVEFVHPSDVTFGPDGYVYVLDWTETMRKTGKGRIYRVYDPQLINSPAVKETQRLISEGMEKRPEAELVKLLAYPDMRIRQEAQFELVDRGSKSIKAFTAVAEKRSSGQLPRLHAIWGLGMLGRKDAKALAVLPSLLNDKDSEVRAQAAKLLGDDHVTKAYNGLVKCLKDDSSRVRFFAAMSLGKLGKKDALPAVIQMLRENNDKDAYLRHAGMMALVRINDKKTLTTMAKDSDRAIRMAALLAMRRLQMPEVAVFLKDSDPHLIVEAARAINDEPVEGAMPELAALAGHLPAVPQELAEALALRVINANFRLGKPANADSLAQFGAAKNLPEYLHDMQVEALNALSMWANPPQRDRLVGIYRPLAAREAKPAMLALNKVANGILASAPDSVRIAAAEAARDLNLQSVGDNLLALVKNTSLSARVRSAALIALVEMHNKLQEEAVNIAKADKDAAVRRIAARLLSKAGGGNVAEQLIALLKDGSQGEKKEAMDALGEFPGSDADEAISQQLGQLIKNPKGQGKMQLEIYEAAAKRTSPVLKAKLKEFAAVFPKNDTLGVDRVMLQGGNAANGKKIFFERAEAQCIRCHRIKNEGSDVGPALDHVGKQKPREYLLESILYPNKVVAPGFESVNIVTKDDELYSGVLKGETPTEVSIAIPGGAITKIKKSDIKTRTKGISPMPEGYHQILKNREIRDLVEYLSSLK